MNILNSILEEKTYSKIIYYVLLIFLIIMPFHAFLMMSLRHFLGLPSLINAWKDLLIFLIFILFLVKIFKEKKIFFKISFLDWAIVIFFIASFISVLVNKVSFIQALWGAKYDLEFLILFLVAKSASFSKLEIKKAFRIYFVVLFIVSVFGFLQIFVLPSNFLVNFGYSEIEARFGHGANRGGKIPAVWNDFGIPRAFSFFSSPNPFGYFLMIGIIFLILFLTFDVFEKKNVKKIYLYILLIPTLVSLAYSHSRSAWLGFLGILFVGFWLIFYFRGKIKEWNKYLIKYFLLSLISCLILFSSLFLKFNLLEKRTFQLVFLHGSYSTETKSLSGSTADHLKDYQNFDFSKTPILEKFFGVGMGKVNSAGAKFPPSYSVESWYLQILLESGLFGFASFLGVVGFFLFYLLKFLKREKDKFIFSVSLGIFLGMIGMSLASFFIPAWFDSSNTLVFWTLAGMIFSYLFKNLGIKDFDKKFLKGEGL